VEAEILGYTSLRVRLSFSYINVSSRTCNRQDIFGRCQAMRLRAKVPGNFAAVQGAFVASFALVMVPELWVTTRMEDRGAFLKAKSKPTHNVVFLPRLWTRGNVQRPPMKWILAPHTRRRDRMFGKVFYKLSISSLHALLSGCFRNIFSLTPKGFLIPCASSSVYLKGSRKYASVQSFQHFRGTGSVNEKHKLTRGGKYLHVNFYPELIEWTSQCLGLG
jgi:hypothetical protein